jgi:hypothetical protein
MYLDVIAFVLSENATGRPVINFGDFEDGSMTACGLPEGVRVQDVKKFSKSLCQDILNRSNEISFHRKSVLLFLLSLVYGTECRIKMCSLIQNLKFEFAVLVTSSKNASIALPVYVRLHFPDKIMLQ